MNRKLVLVLGLFLVFGFVADDCFAQTTTREQRVIGTWVSEIIEDEGDTSVTFTFNQNGTLVLINSGERMNGRWGAAENQIVLTINEGGYEDAIWGEYYISGDGRTMIMILDGDRILFRKR